MQSGHLAVIIKFKVDARAEDQAVGGATEMKHPKLFALRHPLSFLHRDFVGRHFRLPTNRLAIWPMYTRIAPTTS